MQCVTHRCSILTQQPRRSRHKDTSCRSCCIGWCSGDPSSSPDTDVFVLALRRYPDLRDNVSFVTVKGRTHREIKQQPIDQALGKERTAAPPAFHAPSGADNTGYFLGHAKTLC